VCFLDTGWPREAQAWRLGAINATHRFNLAHSHVGLEGPWEGDGFGADGTAPKAPSCTRIVKGALYTFRQKFSHNPGHTLLQTLPLLALALPELLRSENANATVLAPSALFQLLAQQVLPESRILLSMHAPVQAAEVRLLVGRPPFSPLDNAFPAGILRPLRPPLRPSLTATRSSTQPRTVLFLSRSGPLPSAGERERRGAQARKGLSRPGVRSFDNEAELTRRTREIVSAWSKDQGNAGLLKLEVVRSFHTLARQAQAYSRARVFVGPEGSAFSGLAFARDGVSVIEWVGRRDDTLYHLSYLGIAARYFQLLPHWRNSTPSGAAACINNIDDCPWHLTAADMELYAALLREVIDQVRVDFEASARGVFYGGPTPPVWTAASRIREVASAKLVGFI